MAYIQTKLTASCRATGCFKLLSNSGRPSGSKHNNGTTPHNSATNMLPTRGVHLICQAYKKSKEETNGKTHNGHTMPGMESAKKSAMLKAKTPSVAAK